MNDLPALYTTKSDDEKAVANLLENLGIGYRDRSQADSEEISAETGFSADSYEEKLPILKWEDGTQIENFDEDSLKKFLHDRGYEFEDS